MSATARLQPQEGSPSTLLLRFSSVKSGKILDSSSDEESTGHYQQDPFTSSSSSRSYSRVPSQPPVGFNAAIKRVEGGQQIQVAKIVPVNHTEGKVTRLATIKPLNLKTRPLQTSKPARSPSLRQRQPVTRPPRSPLSPRQARSRSSPSAHQPNFSKRPSNGRYQYHSNTRPILSPTAILSTTDLNAALSPSSNLGYNFLNMSTAEPETPVLPFVLAQRRPSDECGSQSPELGLYRIRSRSSTKSTKSSAANSELHLNLGKWQLWDEVIIPGPSPPTTPQPSPLRRNFTEAELALPGDGNRDGQSKKVRRDENLEVPMTPSRAPSKAVQLLGTAGKGRQALIGKDKKVKKRDHFRPLPSSVVREIDNFFGAPAKPSTKKPNLSKTSSSKPLPAPPGVQDRKVGQGKTVEVVGADGQVWHDAEEEAEFAWLLSECGRGGENFLVLSPVKVRAPSSPRSVSSPTTTPGRMDVPADADEDAWFQDNIKIQAEEVEGVGSEDDLFGMPAFTSVYNIPKPHKAPFVLGTKAAERLGIAPGQINSRIKKEGMAFLHMDPYGPKSGEGESIGGKTSGPGRRARSNSLEGSKKRPPPLNLKAAPPKIGVVIQPNTATPNRYSQPILPPSNPRSTSLPDRGVSFVAPRLAPSPPRNSSPHRGPALSNSPSSSPPKQGLLSPIRIARRFSGDEKRSNAQQEQVLVQQAQASSSFFDEESPRGKSFGKKLGGMFRKAGGK